MKLIGFQVTNFRSVEDSGWIDADKVTALIGTNESGKTNLLVPLWKLKPAKEGKINPITDFPRKRYNEIRSKDDKPIFITAHFTLGEALSRQIAKMSGLDIEQVQLVKVQRDLDGAYFIGFPNASPLRSIKKNDLKDFFTESQSKIENQTITKKEETLKSEVLSLLANILSEIEELDDETESQTLQKWITALRAIDVSNAAKQQTIVPAFDYIKSQLKVFKNSITTPEPD